MRPSHKVAIVTGLTEGYTRGMLRGVIEFAQSQTSWITRIGPPTSATIQHLRRWRPDGLILHYEHQHQTPYLRLGIPLVTLCTDGARGPFVGVDHGAVGRMIASHFLERGFRHLAYPRFPRPWCKEREAGLREVFTRGGGVCHFKDITMPVELRRLRDGWVDADHVLGAWIRTLPKPVGVCSTDIWSREIATACRLQGVRVPEQVAIIGVDNDELMCEACDPPLSSVAVPWEKIGFEGAALLRRLLNGEPPPTLPILIPPTGVVERRSSAIVAATDPDVATAVRYIQEHAHEPISVNDLARSVGLGQRTLERRFVKCMGASPQRSLRKVRIVRAKRLLTETQLPIKTIAARTGFSSPERLATVFRRHEGQSPMAYRRQFARADL
ncbi:MAG: DNA-binding transcriptional regulator [bacterium]